MININLLPEALRKKEGMPLPQLLGLVGVGLLMVLIVYKITNYKFDTIPALRQRESSLNRERQRLEEEVKELAVLNAEIARISGLIDAVRELYVKRDVWAKILSDVKHIVNFDQEMSVTNPDMRYIWLTRFTGDRKQISLTGFASASSQNAALQLTERLSNGFLTYSPASMPEKDEEARLNDELRTALTAYEALRRDDPSLPLQGPEEIRLRQRLAEIKAIKSGGIALQPFSELLVPGSLRLGNVTWTRAPAPPNVRRGDDLSVFPVDAWAFALSMTLK